MLWLESFVRRLSRNRVGLGEISGISIAQLTVTGRRTGLPRTVSVLYTPHRLGFVMAGSNWGRAEHPAWSANLLAAEHAIVTVRGKEFRVRVRQVTGLDYTPMMRVLCASWPGFQLEAKLAAGRTFRIFVLTPEVDAADARTSSTVADRPA